MRIEKIAILDEVVARIKDSDYCFILNYGGASVAKMAKLRVDLRKLDSRLLVVKNTYLAKVAKEKGWSDEVNAMLSGPTAVGPDSMAFTSSDQPFSFATFAR